MTKQQIVQQIAESTGISRLQARHTVDAFIKTMASAFAKKETVYLRGFGTFSVVSAKERKARIVSTGQECIVPARNRIKFKPCVELKERIK